MEVNACENKTAKESCQLPIQVSGTDEGYHQPAEKNDPKRTRSNTQHSFEPHRQGKSRKRRKRSSQSNSSRDINSLRMEVQNGAERLRREGISPNTLFFSSLSDDFEPDENLRTAIGVPLEDLKTVQMRNKKMAWAKFATESDCLDTLLRLKLANPALTVSIHRPKKPAGSIGTSLVSNNLNTFQKRLQTIRKNGGVGNTLMFRNFPVEVESDELRDILRESVEKVERQDHCVPLRIRTALSKNGNGRNFWVVYSSVSSCQTAFVAIHLSSVRFRCGKTIKIHAFVHDDSTDADEKRRRERAIDMGVQTSDPASQMDYSTAKRSNLDLLEDLLRQKQTSFVFLSPRKP